MGSMYAKIRQNSTLGSANNGRIADFDETDPYYFLIRENGKILAEGSLLKVKLKLDESYIYKKIKFISRDRATMIATVDL